MSRLSRWLRGLRLLIGQIGALGATADRPVTQGIADMRQALARSPRKDSLSLDHGLALAQHADSPYLIQARLDDVIERRVSYSGVWEPHLLDVLNRLLVRGAVFVDVGANVGAVTLAVARGGLNLDLRVVCIEPSARLAQRLRANLLLNHLDDIQVLEKAAAAENGTVTLQQVAGDEPNQGLSTTRAGGGSHNREAVTVEALTIDSLLTDPKLAEGPLILKIDVEGAEYEVLEGARSTLLRRRPAVVFEFVATLHDDPEDAARRQSELFEETGYVLYSISDRVRSFLPATTLDGNFAGDVLALPVERQV